MCDSQLTLRMSLEDNMMAVLAHCDTRNEGERVWCDVEERWGWMWRKGDG